MDGWMEMDVEDGWMDGWMEDGWMGGEPGWIDGRWIWMNGWIEMAMDGCHMVERWME